MGLVDKSNMLFVFLSLFAVTSALHPYATQEGRIVNGEDVTSTSVAPWQVSLQRFGSHFCGGSLISSTIVMSACHCDNSGVTVVAGTTDYRYPKVSVKGTFTCRPSYSPRNNNDYDYAILTLASPISEDSDISYIQVANKEYAAGTSAQITGWGLTNANLNNVPTQLQGATTTLVSLSQCARTWGSSSLTDRMQCAGGQGVNSGCMETLVVQLLSRKDVPGTLSETPHGVQANAKPACHQSGPRTLLSTAGSKTSSTKRCLFEF